MRDPYAIYARHILGLRPLDPLEADPAAADRGNIIHEILDRFIRSVPGDLPADAEQKLAEIGKDAFNPLQVIPSSKRSGGRASCGSPNGSSGRAATTPYAARFFNRSARRADIVRAGGRFHIDGSGRPDRPPRRRRLFMLDYKTGSPPTDKDIKNGFAPQLPLEAAIAAAGGFEGLDADDVAGLAFWRLSGGAPAGAIKDVKGNLEQIAEEAREAFSRSSRRSTTLIHLTTPSPTVTARRVSTTTHIWRGSPNGPASTKRIKSAHVRHIAR